MTRFTPSTLHSVRVAFNTSLQVVHRLGYKSSLVRRTFASPWVIVLAVGEPSGEQMNNAPVVLPEVVSSFPGRTGGGFRVSAHFQCPHYQYLAVATFFQNLGIVIERGCQPLQVRSLPWPEPTHPYAIYFVQLWGPRRP